MTVVNNTRSLLTLGARAQRGLLYLVCLSVCVCVCVCVCVYDYSRSVGNETAYERYQRVQCHAGLIFKMAIFVQVLRSKVMA